MTTPKRPRSSNSDEEPKLQEIVNKIKGKPNPTIKDLADFMADFLIMSTTLSNRVTAVENEVADLTVKTDLHETRFTNVEDKIHEIENENSEEKKENKKKFEELQEEIDFLKNKTTKNTTEVNLIQQKYLDNEIILKGFPNKPDVEKIVENFNKTYNIANHEVKESYYVSYTLKPRNKTASGKVVHFVVLKFKEKATKIKIFNKKKVTGPLLLNSLITQPSTAEKSKDPTDNTESANNPKITIANKFTKFNLYVQRKLYKAKSLNIIYDYRYHNCLFQIIENEGEDWKRIETYDCLKPIELSIDHEETKKLNPSTTTTTN